MKIYLIVLLLIHLFSCKDNPFKRNNTSTEQTTVIQDSVKIEKNMLLEKEQAIKEFGNPIKQEKILLDNMSVSEFWGDIYYKYSEAERQSKSIYIKEITWEKDTENYITIWYEIQNKTLEPKAFLIWNKGLEF